MNYGLRHLDLPVAGETDAAIDALEIEPRDAIPYPIGIGGLGSLDRLRERFDGGNGGGRVIVRRVAQFPLLGPGELAGIADHPSLSRSLGSHGAMPKT